MTKSEIIEKTLRESRREQEEKSSRGIFVKHKTTMCDDDDDYAYEKHIVEVLEAKLQLVEPETNIRTCEDFSDLNVECCDTCHTFYPHYEMELRDIESGGNAWICCALKIALNPEKHANDGEMPRSWEELLAESERRDQKAE